MNKAVVSCPYSRACGGCDRLSVPYAEQLANKQAYLQRLLGRLAPVRPIAGMENPFYYRNKVHAVFAPGPGHSVLAGTYRAGTHTVVNVRRCALENETAGEIVQTVRELAEKHRLAIYHEDRGTGFLRHILIRTAHATGQIMVTLVTASAFFPAKKAFLKELLTLHPAITTIVLNINNRRTSVVLGEQETVLFGPGCIEDSLCGCRFLLSPRSFYQVNSLQTEILYRKAAELAGLTGTERVIDAYCGIGTIGLSVAGKAKEVIGVELNGQAVRDARRNAQLNGITNARFFCADAGDFMTQMQRSGEKAQVLFMDPPRSGSTPAFLTSAAQLGFQKIVYISCDPVTLKRDIEFLQKKKYKPLLIEPVDMFPHTQHVETVCLLSKLKSNHHIEVDLTMDELDLTAAESKATYDEIKAYVLEHSGLKVSSLYISQVKRKLGLEVGANYNLPKSEDSKQPRCPADKEEAIIDALQHYKMI